MYYLTQELDITTVEISNYVAKGTLDEMRESLALWTKVRAYQKPVGCEGVQITVHSSDPVLRQQAWQADKKKWVKAKTDFQTQIKRGSGVVIPYGMATLIKRADGQVVIFTENFNRTILIEAYLEAGEFSRVLVVDQFGNTEATTRLAIEALPCYDDLYELARQAKRLIS